MKKGNRVESFVKLYAATWEDCTPIVLLLAMVFYKALY